MSAPETAAEFLRAFVQEGEGVTFQTFPDAEAEKGDASLTRVLNARPETMNHTLNVLEKLNRRRAGAFWTVNQTDLTGRSKSKIIRVRAVFVDLDGSPLELVLSGSLLPSSTVESSPGRYHAYWIVADFPLAEFTPVQKVLAARFGADPVVCDLPRVMRLPGFKHQKGELFVTRVLELHPERVYTRSELHEAFPEIRGALEAAQQPKEREAEPVPSTGTPDAHLKYALTALENEVQTVLAAREGERNNAVNKSAYSVGQLVGAGALSESVASSVLKDAAQRIGLPDGEAVATIHSGLKAGKLKPRDLSEIGKKFAVEMIRADGKKAKGKGAKREATNKPSSVYTDENGVLSRWVLDDHADPPEWKPIPLCSFTARIVAETLRDDGAERTNLFTIEGKLENGQALERIDVPSAQFGGLSWVTERWGARAYTLPSSGAKDHTRVAIHELSIADGFSSRTVFAHTGWRTLKDGRHVYLHAGGAIGQNGTVNDVEVQLKGSLERYVFPEPVEGQTLEKAVRHSLGFLSVAPDRVSIPVLSAVYRAVLGPARFTLFLEGRTGSMKSGLAALGLQHFGAVFDRHNLPGNWTSTENQLERLCFEAKDALTVIDDFNPTGSSQDVKRWHAKAERVLRAQGNGTGRGRMVWRPGGIYEQRADTPPRGLVMATGEDVPNGHSLRARLLIVELQPGDVDLEKLIQASQIARSGEYTRALAGFVRWLAPKLEAMQAQMIERASELVARYPSSHGRTTDAATELHAALEVFLEFALEIGALTLEESNAIQARAFMALSDVIGGQAAIQQGSDPVRRFLELLEGVLSGGHAHLADASSGAEPENPERYGWRLRTFGAGEHERTEWQPQGKLIGWLAKGGAVYLEPEGAFGAVQRLSSEQGDSLPVQGRTLWKRMAERGLIARDGNQSTVVRRFLEQRRRVIHLHAHALESTGNSQEGHTPETRSDFSDTRSSAVPDGLEPVTETHASLRPETVTGTQPHPRPEDAGESRRSVTATRKSDRQETVTAFATSQTAQNPPSLQSLEVTNTYSLSLSDLEPAPLEGEL